MTWWDGPLCGYDCETTGVDLEEARIVTAAIVFVGGGLAPETVTFLADPGVEIPDEAAKVHGITTERARAEGAPAREVLVAIRRLLATAIHDGRPLVVMNARFDLTILDRELRRHGLEPLPECLVIDPFVCDKHVDRFRRGSRKLEMLCAHYGVMLDEAHNAAADALAACRIAYRMGQRGLLGDDHLLMLHARQIEWAREQAESLSEYFARKGEPQHVETAWPLVPAEITANH